MQPVSPRARDIVAINRSSISLAHGLPPGEDMSHGLECEYSMRGTGVNASESM